jgi:sterol 3beta-glucosyltransferase
MKIVIVTIGSTGDTLPFVALGWRLQAAGHEVAVAAQAAFEQPIRAAGLEFRKMPGDIRQDLTSELGQRLYRAGSWLQAIGPTARLAEKILREVGDGMVAAAHGADLLIVHRIALMHGYLVANAMGIPCLVFELFPSGLAPTEEFLPAGFGATSLGTWANRAVYGVLRASAGKSKMYAGVLDDFCRKSGVPRLDPSALYDRMEREQWPIYHAFSPRVVPRPSDWRAGLEVIGYFWPRHSADWQPPAELVDFLHAGPPPVFVGLGSLVPEDAERVAQTLTAATRKAKVRAVIQAGWAKLATSERSEDVLSIGSVPHSWLFPKVSAVVHAAGAGVTAAGLRAGIPAIPVPAMNDQPFWADRLVKLGVSPGSIRLQRLSADGLAHLIRQATAQPSYRVAARAIARRMRAEDAAGHVVDTVRAIADGARAARS